MLETYKSKAAREAQERAYYERLDRDTPEREMTMEDSQRMLCRTCNHYASIILGGYGFSRPDPWKLYGCRCKYKYVWVWTIKSE